MFVVARHSPESLSLLLPKSHSFLAVDFFFCLSGFVIAYSYEAKLRASLTLRRFTLARIIRLYPLAILGTLLGFAWMCMRGGLWGSSSHVSLLASLLLSLACLPNVTAGSLRSNLFPFNFPVWSLFFEMVANIAYALFLKRSGRSGIFVTVATISLALLIYLGVSSGSIDGGVDFINSHLGLLRVCFSFTVGVLLFRLRKNVSPKLLRGTWAGVAACIISLVMVSFIAIATPFTSSVYYDLAVVAILFPLVVYFGSLVDVPERLVAPCVFLGELSYPVYILHQPFVRPLFSTHLVAIADRNPPVGMFLLPVYLVCVAVATWAIGKYVDEPIRKRLSALVSRTL
jgi:peptidoglycan/LPS O-acetylase OafA/YrhL